MLALTMFFLKLVKELITIISLLNIEVKYCGLKSI